MPAMMVPLAIASPITSIVFLLMFGVPIAVLLIGVLAYFLKPYHRKTIGRVSAVIGVIELLIFLSLTRSLSLVPILLYTLSALAIALGVFSLRHDRTQGNE